MATSFTRRISLWQIGSRFCPRLLDPSNRPRDKCRLIPFEEGRIDNANEGRVVLDGQLSLVGWTEYHYGKRFTRLSVDRPDRTLLQGEVDVLQGNKLLRRTRKRKTKPLIVVWTLQAAEGYRAF